MHVVVAVCWRCALWWSRARLSYLPSSIAGGAVLLSLAQCPWKACVISTPRFYYGGGLYAGEKTRWDRCVCVCVSGGGREPAVCNVAEAPKHCTTGGAVYFFILHAPPPPLRRRFIAFALQFLVWLAENCEGDFAMNQQNKNITRLTRCI